MVTYELVRGRRKTISLCVKKDGQLVVRAPLSVKVQLIDAFVKEKEDWIKKHQEKYRMASESRRDICLTKEQVKACKREAKTILIRRAEYFAVQMDVKYDTIKVNSAKHRWGSCSQGGVLNFTYRLLFVPLPLLDYVVVHELAHLRFMDHSRDFWNEVGGVLRDYSVRRKQLADFSLLVEVIELPQVSE